MINLYYHSGSGNHGCEAIVRSTSKLLDMPMTLWSFNDEEDLYYGIDSIVDVKKDNSEIIRRGSLKKYISAINHKLFGTDYYYIRFAHDVLYKSVKKDDLWLSIGGDNYCYTGLDKLGYYNKMIHNRGAKTVLWGCSVELSALTPAVIKDLKSYDLITVRESLSYKALSDVGIIDNVVLCSDPAFCLDRTDVSLPNGFEKSNTIGINLSPLVSDISTLVKENYIKLIEYILNKTSDNVLLIPHVIKEKQDDRKPLKELLDYFSPNNRIFMVDDCNCMKLKGYISQCKMFVGARTHSTIAAYSSCVPTLVVGYSIKSRGIANDIFGTSDNYVISSHSFKSDDDLLGAYLWLADREKDIRLYLLNTMPEYQRKTELAVSALKDAMGINR